jgi:hypothetical protein
MTGLRQAGDNRRSGPLYLEVVTTPRDDRVICWAERGALILLVIYLFLHTIPSAWRGLITDFPNYYMSARNGVWNLWLRDERTGATRRVADTRCNQIQPSQAQSASHTVQ